jgi:hypothetical protein
VILRYGKIINIPRVIRNGGIIRDIPPIACPTFQIGGFERLSRAEICQWQCCS